MKRQDCIDAILIERARQERLKREGRFLHTLSDEWPAAEKLAVCTEEFLEMVRAHQDGSPEEFKTEMVQLAACLVAWLESL